MHNQSLFSTKILKFRYTLQEKNVTLAIQINRNVMSEDKYILVKGARVNSLKNVEVSMPRNKLVVVTG
mgnify:FL=1